VPFFVVATCKAGVEGGDCGGGGGDSWAHSKPPHANIVNSVTAFIVRRVWRRKERVEAGDWRYCDSDPSLHVQPCANMPSSVIRFICIKTVVSQKKGLKRVFIL
jgi:hypothetical protein